MLSSSAFCSAARCSQTVWRAAASFLGHCHALPGVVCLLVLACLGLPAHAANVTWKLNAEGYWDIAANWSSGQLPTSADDVFNNLATATIVHRSGSDTVNSFLSQGQFILSGGTLTVQSTLQVNNSFLMYGGTLHGGTVQAGSGGQGITFANNVNNILDGVTVNANMDLSSGGIARIHNGLTLNSTATLNNSGTLAFEGTQSLKSGTILFGDASANSLTIEGANTLTLGKNVLVHGQSGTIGNQKFTTGITTLVNQGTLSADVSGGSWTVQPNYLINTGTVQALNGANLAVTSTTFSNAGILQANGGSQVTVSGSSLTNNGTITAQNGGSVSIGSSLWSNLGTIQATGTNSVVTLGGTLTNNGTLSASGGGLLALTGVLANVNQTLDLSFLGSAFQMQGGRIIGGTVSGPGSLVVTSTNNWLDNVTVGATLDLSNGGQLHTDGLVLEGSALLDNSAILAFEGTQTLNGGTVVFGGSSGSVQSLSAEGSSTLTLGPGVVLHGQNASIGHQQFTNGTNTLINNGTISADVANGVFHINPNNFTNNGTLQAANGGSLYVDTSAWKNTGTLLSTGSGSVFYLATALTNAGTLNVNNGGTFSLTGTISNSNATLLDNSSNGTFTINGGGITGGTVGASNLLAFSSSNTNFLSGVTLGAGLNLSNGGQVRVSNGMPLTGTATLDNNARLYSMNSQTFDQSTIVFGGSLNSTQHLSIEGSNTLTLGSGLTVHGQNGTIGEKFIAAGTNTLINNGSIASDVPGGTISLVPNNFTNGGTATASASGSTLSIAVGSFSNSGTVQVQNGGQLSLSASTGTSTGLLAASGAGSIFTLSNTLTNASAGKITADNNALFNLTGTLTNAGTLNVSSGGIFNLTGAINNNNATLLDNSSNGQFLVNGGGITGGTIGASNLLAFTTIGSNFLSGVTLGAGLNLSNGGQVRVSNGMPLTGTATLDNNAHLYSMNSQTFDQSTIVFGGSLNSTQHLSIEGSNTLTLGSGLTVHGQNGTIGEKFITAGTNTLVNNGTIAADVPGGTISIVPNNFTNGGTVTGSASGSTTSIVVGTLTNSGTMQVQNSGQLSLYSNSGTNTGLLTASGAGSVFTQSNSLTNASAGKITVSNNALFNLTGTLTNAGTLNVNSGGTFNLTGTINNSNATLLDNSSNGQFVMNGGGITGGTISASNLLAFTANSSNFLSGVTLGSGLNLSNGGQVRVSNGLPLSGTAILDNNARLYSTNSQTFDQSTIVFGGSFNSTQHLTVEGSNTLTLGSGLTVHGQNGTIGEKFITAGTNTLVNNGSINSDMPGGTISIVPNNFTNSGMASASASGSTLSITVGALTNSGTVQVQNGGQLSLYSNGGNNTGLLAASGAGSNLTLSGSLTNASAGKITVSNNALFNLTGTLTNAGTLNFSSGGMFDLTGTINNSNATLLDNSSNGTFSINGGGVTGGTIGTSNLLAFSTSSSNFLSGVALQSGLNLSNGGQVRVSSGLSLNGTATLDNNARLYSTNSQTFDSGTIAFGGSSSSLQHLTIEGSNTLTLGSGLTVHGQNGTIGEKFITAGTNTLVNNGTINADVPGGTLSIVPNNFTNNGTLAVQNGSALNVTTSTTTNSGTVQVGPHSQTTFGNLTQTAGKTIADGTLTFGKGSGLLSIQGGSLSGGGTINGNLSNAATLTPGDKPGLLTLNGAYTQSSAGLLDIEIGGLVPGLQFDQFKISGKATLGGTLDISLLNGFQPQLNDTYEILDFGSLSGTFATVNTLNSLGPNLKFTVAYNANNILLTVTDPPSGPAAVPEPGARALLLAVGLVGGGLLFQTRQRRGKRGRGPHPGLRPPLSQ